MSRVFKEISSMDDARQDDLRKFSRLLLYRQHIFQRVDKGAYKFISDPQNRPVVEMLMNGCGYDLMTYNASKNNGLIGIVPMSDLSFNRIKKVPKPLVKILIILYQIYMEHFSKGAVDKNFCVDCNIKDVAQYLGVDDKDFERNYSGLEENLKEISEFGIIEKIIKESKDSHYIEFLINESITIYVTSAFIDRWERPEKYRSDGSLKETVDSV